MATLVPGDAMGVGRDLGAPKARSFQWPVPALVLFTTKRLDARCSLCLERRANAVSEHLCNFASARDSPLDLRILLHNSRCSAYRGLQTQVIESSELFFSALFAAVFFGEWLTGTGMLAALATIVGALITSMPERRVISMQVRPIAERE
ncbi:hypothetical protein [Mesorhizobium amorphae]|nr:hypothetical protein [Mesorhizobium amorphae]